MDYSLSGDQQAIIEAAEKICEKFGLDYWLERDLKGGFPEEYFQEVARGGWLGIAMPEEYGGAGLGITEAALFLRTVAAGGGALAAASAIHMNIFGLHPVVLFGTEEQKRRILPPFTRGETKACFAVTEPDTGLNTTKLKVKAELKGDKYYITGKKVFISTAQVAGHMLILARTTPIEQVKKRTEGLSLFYTRLDRDYVQIREIEKMGRKAVDTNELFIDGLPVPVEDRIGEEGKGLEYIFHGMNAERCLVGAEAVGIGQAAIRLATQYAKDRIVFDRPIGMNQGIQHPLAQSWAELEAANHMIMAAASMLDRGLPCGTEANAAKLLASQAGMKACQTAILTHGGFGYAKEYHVERFLREMWVPFIAPVSPQLILSNIAERKLGLPKSY
ncbi:acyl-CoA/acyl-ACP dehydrogenase [Sphingomonas sp. CL5.1]|uniref:acyl-CoA dehydrogenase family protein n=1 Tax=Sphingomonas sp. CL5.1 TaxID=2653203 RepID=UPI00158162D5|nr:acyl-CoA dehydrogenase family protein [Sphingomonas sp. CL5.1]QKS00578.1 acyl-CoA/acyl-ACP dehydrogenase [Sphingomonas sp. CL5.1]